VRSFQVTARETDRRHRPDGLRSLDAAALRREPDEARSTVLRLVLQRAQAGSRPREREDGHVVCLVIEGGGMRGAVTAGMCVLLEAAGLTSAFDRIYGVSAGALNAWAAAAGQAALGATHYQDAVTAGVVSRIGPLRGRPLVDFDLLFEELIAARKPLSFERLAQGPELWALATSLETMSLRLLGGFTSVDEVMDAVRASAFLPRFAGEPRTFRGERMADGSLVEPIPFQSALAAGATHVLVLRSRAVGYRRPALSELGEAFAVRENPALSKLIKARPATYNRQAAALERYARQAGARVDQITVPGSTRLVGPLQADGALVADALRQGAKAMASAILTVPVDLCWQPVLYCPHGGEDALGAGPEHVEELAPGGA
jgi:predicted patatin/cPLA2 family phospholipase